MPEFTFEARLGKKIDKSLNEKGIMYALLAGHSSIRNQNPSNYPGDFGNGVSVTIRVREEDDDVLREIHERPSPPYLRQEVENSLHPVENKIINFVRRLANAVKL